MKLRSILRRQPKAAGQCPSTASRQRRNRLLGGFALSLAALLCAACTNKGYCLANQPYDHVASIPPITGGEGLNIPNSPTALRVPAPPPESQDESFGNRVQDPKHKDRTHVECLDEPPPLPANAGATTTVTQ